MRPIIKNRFLAGVMAILTAALITQAENVSKISAHSTPISFLHQWREQTFMQENGIASTHMFFVILTTNAQNAAVVWHAHELQLTNLATTCNPFTQINAKGIQARNPFAGSL